MKEVMALKIPYQRVPINRRYPWRMLSSSLQIGKIIERHEIDIVHTQSVFPTVDAWLGSKSTSQRCALIWHDRGIKPRNYALVARCFNFLADFVITNSQYERQLLIKHGLWRKKIKTIYNGFDWTIYSNEIDIAKAKRELGLSPDDHTVGIVARLHPDKGHKFFLQAACQIVRLIPHTRFLLVGGGPLEPELRKAVSRLNIKDNVRFTGFIEEIPKVMALLDVLVLPSTRETFGRVLVEAAAMGKPVVATKVGGIPEIVDDGETGFLIRPGDPDALAEKVLTLLRDQVLRNKMGDTGRRRVMRRFSLDGMTNEIEEVYYSTLSRKTKAVMNQGKYVKRCIDEYQAHI